LQVKYIWTEIWTEFPIFDGTGNDILDSMFVQSLQMNFEIGQ